MSSKDDLLPRAIDLNLEANPCLSRRLIGRRFDDETVKKDIESWPFKVVDKGGSPMVQVEYLKETKTFSPQEISSMVLMKVWELFENPALRLIQATGR